MATKPAKRQPNWIEISAAYQVNTCSVRALARRHGVSHTAVQKRAAADGWERHPRPVAQRQQKISAQPAPKIVDPKLIVDRGRDLALRLLDELDATTAHLGEIEAAIVNETADDPDGRRRQVMLRAVDLPRRAAILKDIATAARTLGDAAPGKKEQAAAAAGQAASGRYATPATPLRLVQGAKP